MAVIMFTLEELLDVLASNDLLPAGITRLKVKDQTLHFVIRTGSLVLPFVPASLTFTGFEDGKALFELSIAGGRATRALAWLTRAYAQRMPDCTTLDYPQLVVDLQAMLKKKNINNLRIDSIAFDEGRFTIVTSAARPQDALERHPPAP